MKQLISILVYSFIINTVSGQIKKIVENQDTIDNKYFFELLYGINDSENGPLNIIKLEFSEKPFFAILNKGEFQSYCKGKYNVNDSIASTIGLNILRLNQKISLSDTIYFDNTIKHYYPVRILEIFRKLSLLDFFNIYVGDPRGLNIFLIAYLFEKRILYEVMPCNCISIFELNRIENRFGLYWDENKEEWRKK